MRLSAAAEAGVKQVAEGVAEHIEAEYGEGDGDAGDDRKPRRFIHEDARATGEHLPQVG